MCRSFYITTRSGLTQAAIAVLRGAALRDGIAERIDQIDRHGFTIAHDLHHTPQALALGAKSYLDTAIDQLGGVEHPREEAPESWPFEDGWKPADHARANLVKGFAMLWAAIDRIDAAPRDERGYSLHHERNVA